MHLPTRLRVAPVRVLRTALSLLAAGVIALCATAPIAAEPATPSPALMKDTPAINPALLKNRWSARWITVPGADPHDFGVYHFRRAFDLPANAARPDTFVVHVTADNRYQLFVNGERVSEGPDRGDLKHWRYETVDIAPRLRAGRNVLAAVVWNFGEDAPMAQITAGTGFLLQGDTERERAADTDSAWKCARVEAYRPIHISYGEVHGYYVAGPSEDMDAARYPWGWEQPDFDDSANSGWQPAAAGTPGCPRDSSDAPNPWMLVPSDIPPQEERPERLASVRRAEGVTPPAGFPQQAAPFTLPAHTTAELLLDNGHETTAYPELVVSGGAGARVQIAYAESLFSEWARGTVKGNRDEVAGKEFHGYHDLFRPDGGSRRLFRPLWWRTYRYVQLRVETGDAPLTVEDVRGVFTGYPFERKAELSIAAPDVDRILDVGWRTARLCAHETYMDCPYYEQLQYVGDTRIQCLVSLYMSGDDRLMRQAIEQIDASRTAEGATMSRAPTRLQQYIPSFCLWWVGMLHDDWMYRDDPAFVRAHLPGAQAVLSFFAAYQKPNGSLRKLPWWLYIDAAPGWHGDNPPQAEDESCAPFDLMLLLAYHWTAEMEDALGSKALAGEYRRKEKQLRETVQKLYWDAGRGLYADTDRKQLYSQHTQALAVLADVATGAAAHDLIRRALDDRSLVQCALFFRYYLYAAANKAGEGDRYLDALEGWRAMLRLGLTTFPEFLDYPGHSSRSDCHAWSASPNFELFRTVLGVDTAAPGFRRVRIRPFLSTLTEAAGAVPHPRGMVRVHLKREGDALTAEVELPAGVTGEVVWNGKTAPIGPGRSVTRL